MPEGPGAFANRAEAHARLRAIAHAPMRTERRDHTPTPTALVREARLRMASAADRRAAPGFGAMRLTMRGVLRDHARGRARWKRRRPQAGAGRVDPDACEVPSHATTVTSLRQALQRLRAASPERADAWQAHHGRGEPTEAIAAARGCSQRNVQLWLRAANVFLRACLAVGG